MKHTELTILFPYRERAEWRTVPEETWHDLGLDGICDAVTPLPAERELLRRVMTSLTADARVARYRTEVFDDIRTHSALRERMMKLLDHIKFLNDYGAVKRPTEEVSGIWDLLHRLDELHDYVVTVEALRECLSDPTLRSQGLRDLRDAVGALYEDSGFAALKRDVEALRADTNTLKSVTVGINLNERFEAVSLGLVSVNNRYFSRSGVLRSFADFVSRRDEVKDGTEWDGDYTYRPVQGDTLTGRMEGVAMRTMALRSPLIGLTMAGVAEGDGMRELTYCLDGALTNVLSLTTKRLRDVLGRYIAVSIADVAGLIPELIYYVRWAEWEERLAAGGWHFCLPEVRDEPACRMEARGLYNLKLTSLGDAAAVTPNDLVFDETRRVWILTGANRGGKTTITQAVGQLFLLAQGGVAVPADSFVYAPADAVFTHFPADEDKTLDLGRLGEECRRFRTIYTACTARSLLLLNETFSTTSFEEGYFIARDAVRAILLRGARTVYNTHMHKLARELDEVNGGGTAAQACSLTVRPGSFRAEAAPPEGRSWAGDVAEKYGVTFECLTRTPPPEA